MEYISTCGLFTCLISIWKELRNQSRENCKAVRVNKKVFSSTFCLICFINSDASKYIRTHWKATSYCSVLKEQKTVEWSCLLFEWGWNPGFLRTFAGSSVLHQPVFCQLNAYLTTLSSNLTKWWLSRYCCFQSKNSHSLVWYFISYQLLFNCEKWLEKQRETREIVITNSSVSGI